MKLYCIPDLEFDGFTVVLDEFGAELDSNSGIMIELEFFFEELKEDAGFANTWEYRKMLLVSPMTMYLNK